MRRCGPRWRSRGAPPTPPRAPARPLCDTTTFAPEIGWPEVAEAALDEPALVRAGVEAGDAPLGAVDGADAWGTEPAAPSDPLLVPGTDAAGSEATDGAFTEGTLGTVTEGTLGAVTEGTVTDGTVTPGTVTPGTVTEGTVTPGTVTDGVVTPGTVTDELPGTDTVSDGRVSALLARGCIAKTASSESPRAATAAIQRPARVGRPPVRGVCRVPIGLPLIASNTYPTLTKLNRLSTAARLHSGQIPVRAIRGALRTRSAAYRASLSVAEGGRNWSKCAPKPRRMG